MKRKLHFVWGRCVLGAAALLLVAGGIRAQDLLVPAGTLLQCTMDEPNFSSATAAVGDPVLCHLKSFQEFGKTVFPRGSMLAGHLEDAKEPGHFVGKGYLKITFDRVIVPTGDVPVPAKVISAKGYKVDKQGDIRGKGHATRDVVEWMIPPLWPWKVLMLPAKGPRPTLKGEEPMKLRLMDDIVVPQAAAHAFLGNPNRPPYASNAKPSSFSQQQSQPTTPTVPASQETQLALGASPMLLASASTPATPADTKADTLAVGTTNLTTAEPVSRFTILVLKSEQVYEVTKYRVDGGTLQFQRADGTPGSVATADVDWRKTSELTEKVQSVDLPSAPSQTH
jgi:hypothetical protein